MLYFLQCNELCRMCDAKITMMSCTRHRSFEQTPCDTRREYILLLWSCIVVYLASNQFFSGFCLSLYFSLSHIYYFDLLRILPTNRLQFWLRRKLWCCIVTADKIVKQMNAWPVLPLGGRGSMHTHRAILSTNMHKNQLFTVNHKKKHTREGTIIINSALFEHTI